MVQFIEAFLTTELVAESGFFSAKSSFNLAKSTVAFQYSAEVAAFARQFQYWTPQEPYF